MDYEKEEAETGKPEGELDISLNKSNNSLESNDSKISCPECESKMRKNWLENHMKHKQ